MTRPADRSHLSIGEVLSLLQDEFPDVTISKIRFLESQGLLDPERTPSGYRKFYDGDIDRLRWILRQQKEHYLPLKVIKDRLDDRGGQGALPLSAPGPALPGFDDGASLAGRPATNGSGRLGLVVDERPPDAPSAAPDAERGPPAGAPAGRGGEGPGRGPGNADRTRGRVPTGRAGGFEPGGVDGDLRGLHGAFDGGDVDPAAWTSAPPSEPVAPRARRTEYDPARPGRPAGLAPAPPAGGTGTATGTGAGSPVGTTRPATGDDVARPGTNPRPDDRQGAQGPHRGPSPASRGGEGDRAGVSLTIDELAEASGMQVRDLRELEQFGLLESHVVGDSAYYDADALVVARTAGGFLRHGIEARHLRSYKVAIDREAGLFEQIVLPLLKQRNPEAHRRASQIMAELIHLGEAMRGTLLHRELRDHID